MNTLGATDQIIIFVRKNDSEIAEKYDRDDVCMKAAVASFEILARNTQGSDCRCGKEPQIVLRLRDFSTAVKYAMEDGTVVDFEYDKEADVVACAVESVLQFLHKSQCVGKDIVSFQSRRGTYATNDLKISGLSIIHLNPNSGSSFSLNFKEGIISRTYAYLEERKLCLFLNDISSDTLGKIEGILTELFPQHDQ